MFDLSKSVKIAALDIGTNTVLLLIGELEGGALRVLRDDHAIARLGEGVDRDRRISEAAYQRFLRVLLEHKQTMDSNGVESVAAVGTSALRDAENQEEILGRAKRDTGIAIEILSGEDEARWTYRGALVGMQFDAATIGVVDIGGGSTEVSFGDASEFQSGQSFDIGAVRITERCFATNPITSEAAEEARKIIRGVLQPLVGTTTLDEFVAVAGTPTTLAAMHQGLPAFDAHKVQNYLLRTQAIDQLLDVLIKTPTATLLERFPAVNKARADILPGGTLILREAMDILGVDGIRVSTHGLRYGILLREAERMSGGVPVTVVE